MNKLEKIRNHFLSNGKDALSEEEYTELHNFRMSYRDSLKQVYNLVNSVAQSIDNKSITTFRIKRIESILSKMKRQPKMDPKRMNDVAGCRCILSKVKSIYDVIQKINEAIASSAQYKDFTIHDKIWDYIKEKREDGYRSVHIVIKTPEKKCIEVQLRTFEHHNWATLVETTDLIYETKLKEFHEPQDLYTFHQLLSIEDPSPEQKRQVVMIDKKRNYVAKLLDVYVKNNQNIYVNFDKKAAGSGDYYLLAADSSGQPSIRQFVRFDEAENAYFKEFIDYHQSKNIVLAYIGDAKFERVMVAYNNYFLNNNQLLEHVVRTLADVIKLDHKKWIYPPFGKYKRLCQYIDAINQAQTRTILLRYTKGNRKIELPRELQDDPVVGHFTKNVTIFLKLYVALHQSLDGKFLYGLHRYTFNYITKHYLKTLHFS